MIFIVKKVGREYLVKNRMTKATKGRRTSNSEAQKLAAELERAQRRVGFLRVVERGAEAR
jgi:hypothetical protein